MTSKGHLLQHPYNEQGHLQIDQVAQDGRREDLYMERKKNPINPPGDSLRVLCFTLEPKQ